MGENERYMALMLCNINPEKEVWEAKVGLSEILKVNVAANTTAKTEGIYFSWFSSSILSFFPLCYFFLCFYFFWLASDTNINVPDL